MIILQPNTSTQTISIMPRMALVNGGSIVLSIRRDGDGLSESISPLDVSSNGNFTDLDISSTILSEGSTYFIEVTLDGALAYRDKVYATSQNDYSVKHIISQDRYTQPTGEINDNTYII